MFMQNFHDIVMGFLSCNMQRCHETRQKKKDISFLLLVRLSPLKKVENFRNLLFVFLINIRSFPEQ